MEVSDAAGMTDASAVSHQIRFDEDLCTGCGLCEAFCPMEVIVMGEGAPRVVHAEACWGCETCSGQCPVHAIRIEATAQAAQETGEQLAPPLAEEVREQYREWARVLREVLGLRWHPVAVSLIREGEPLPDVPLPEERLRYCQALMAARRGKRGGSPAS